MFGLTLATAGALTALTTFWPMPTEALSGSGIAAGVAFVNSLARSRDLLVPTPLAGSRTGRIARNPHFICCQAQCLSVQYWS